MPDIFVSRGTYFQFFYNLINVAVLDSFIRVVDSCVRPPFKGRLNLTTHRGSSRFWIFAVWVLLRDTLNYKLNRLE